MMMPRNSLLAAALACAGAAQAQSTLGELIDLGARKITPAQAQALGPLGVTRQGADSDIFMTLHPDGTVVGSVSNKQGHGSSEARGTWTMDAGGKRCVDVDLPAFHMKWNQCGYTWQLGRQLFAAPSDTDRDARVTAYMATAHIKQ